MSQGGGETVRPAFVTPLRETESSVSGSALPYFCDTVRVSPNLA